MTLITSRKKTKKTTTTQDNTEQDLTKEEYKTSHLLRLLQYTTVLDNLDINFSNMCRYNFTWQFKIEVHPTFIYNVVIKRADQLH